MIKLPDTNEAFQYENNFYLTCTNQRINKIISQYELFKMTLGIPGDIVECGVFKGVSLIRFATFRDMASNPYSKKIIGFDTFTVYPEPNLPNDKLHRENFVKAAGIDCISKKQLLDVLSRKRIENIELIDGDIMETVPSYIKQYPNLRLSLLYMDCTIYEPTLVALKNFYDRILKGGLIILNGYGKEHASSETEAVEEFFNRKDTTIRRLPFSFSPCYIIK